MTSFNESTVEQAAMEWLSDLGWETAYGPDIAPGTPAAERDNYTEVVLERRLRDAVERLNPYLEDEALETALRRITNPDGPTQEARNRFFHLDLINGITVERRGLDGTVSGVPAKIIDFEDPHKNDWLAVNQFTVQGNQQNRRLDIVLFVNGLPLGNIELKNPADESTDIWEAWDQFQTYQAELLDMFSMNEVQIISDGILARIGPLNAGKEWFKPWRTMESEEANAPQTSELQVMLEGTCDPTRFLNLVKNFTVFDNDGSGKLIKKLAGYHQLHAVQAAVEETLRATALQREAALTHQAEGSRPGGAPGDRRIGVVWHNQGSGKSLTMAFYTGAIVREPAMENPTIVVLTDRNDLDGQLFGTFSRSQDLLRQTPTQADSRADLRQKLSVATGGVVFTTIQKFFPDEKGDTHPLLSDRRNIVVIADEAHRSQYGFITGFASHLRAALPHASFLGFTGTPIELGDANTRAVFGDYISVYDIQRSEEDRATVPIYYESRLAKLVLDESEKPNIDPDFEEATEGEEIEHKEALKTKWAQLETIVGSENRVTQISQDLVDHFEARLEEMDGKAMIVCMSRRICVELYNELVRLRPDWYDQDDSKGQIKIVMTDAVAVMLEKYEICCDMLHGFDAVAVMLEKYEICCDMLHGFDWTSWSTATPQETLSIIAGTQEHILAQDSGKERFLKAVLDLSRAFALSVPDEETIRIRNDVRFFQTLRAALLKKSAGDQTPSGDLDSAIRQIVSRAVASEGVVDIFAEAGLKKPDISVLSDEFLDEVKGMKHRNLAVDLLQKLIKGELSTRRRQNMVQARSFAGMLEETIRRYQNRAIEAAQVIEELVELAKQIREATARGEELGLTEDELAFYDALETNDSAVKILGDDTLRAIAQELVETIRNNVTVDWTLRESVRANMRIKVR